MVDIGSVRAWVCGDVYEGLLEVVSKALHLAVNGDVTPDIVLQHDANKLNAAKLKIDDLIAVARDGEIVCNYVKSKLQGLDALADEQEGKSVEDEDDVVIKTHPFYSNFLNIYLIELHFLKSNPAELEAYLKSIRIPGGKKYSEQLHKMYKQSLGE